MVSSETCILSKGMPQLRIRVFFYLYVEIHHVAKSNIFNSIPYPSVDVIFSWQLLINFISCSFLPYYFYFWSHSTVLSFSSSSFCFPLSQWRDCKMSLCQRHWLEYNHSDYLYRYYKFSNVICFSILFYFIQFLKIL